MLIAWGGKEWHLIHNSGFNLFLFPFPQAPSHEFPHFLFPRALYRLLGTFSGYRDPVTHFIAFETSLIRDSFYCIIALCHATVDVAGKIRSQVE